MGRGDPIPGDRYVVTKKAAKKKSGRTAVVVCVNRMRGPRGKCCGQNGSLQIAAALEAGIRDRGLDVELERIVCLGKCDVGPNLKFVGGDFRHDLTLGDVPRLLDEFEEIAGTCDEKEMLYPGA